MINTNELEENKRIDLWIDC